MRGLAIEPRPVVEHADSDAVFPALGDDLDICRRAAIFDRVAQQVPDDLTDIAVVGADGRQARRDDGRNVRPEPDRPFALDDRRQDPLEEARFSR